MPPVDRLKPIRAASSESGYTLPEFMRGVARRRHLLGMALADAPLGRRGDCPLSEVRAGSAVQALPHDATASVVDLHRLRASRPPDSRDDLPQVVHVPALVVLRHVPHH